MSGSVFSPNFSTAGGSPYFGGANPNSTGSPSNWQFTPTPQKNEQTLDPDPPMAWKDDGGSRSGFNQQGSAARDPYASNSPSLLVRDLTEYASGRTSLSPANSWRDNSGSTSLPPPPMGSLYDTMYSTPATAIPLPFGSPPGSTEHGGFGSPPFAGSGVGYGGLQNAAPLRGWQSPVYTSPSPSLARPVMNGGKDSLASEQHGSLLSVTPPPDVIKPPQPSQEDKNPADYWVTVFGFSSGQLSTVVEEFEKCGPVVAKVHGPAGANWVHLQYQKPYNAKRALSKNGLQISANLIVGVKAVDQATINAVTSEASKRSDPWLQPEPDATFRSRPPVVPSGLNSARPYLLQQSTGGPVVSQPNTSTYSKVMDFLFGS